MSAITGIAQCLSTALHVSLSFFLKKKKKKSRSPADRAHMFVTMNVSLLARSSAASSVPRVTAYVLPGLTFPFPYHEHHSTAGQQARGGNFSFVFKRTAFIIFG
jgi:hypothetical protein